MWCKDCILLRVTIIPTYIENQHVTEIPKAGCFVILIRNTFSRHLVEHLARHQGKVCRLNQHTWYDEYEWSTLKSKEKY